MTERDALAIVTGTTHGLGRSVAGALLDRGWQVLGIARSARPEEFGDGYEQRCVDLADPEQVRRFAEEELRERLARNSWRRVGLVQNAARIEPIGSADELDIEELGAAFAVNAIAPIWLTGFVVREVPERPLRIVHVSSGAASNAYPGWTAYCATKAALAIAGQVLAAELRETAHLRGRDVALVSYAPHVVDTGMQERIRGTEEGTFPRRSRFVEMHRRGELVSPEGPAREIAALLERDDLPLYSELRHRP